MKSKRTNRLSAKLLAILLVITLVTPSFLTAYAGEVSYAVSSENASDYDSITAKESSSPAVRGQNSVVVESRETQDYATSGNQTNTVDFRDTDGANIETELKPYARSRTKNIIGDVIANMMNQQFANEAEEDGVESEISNLDEYPLDPHERSYYGDSPRVRPIDETNYLVYRDSYLIISQEESANYDVRWSENKSTAYVTPAVSPDDLEGKTGLILLEENFGNDEVMVFDGMPAVDGNTLVVSVLDSDKITLNQIFSDGKVEYTFSSEDSPKESDAQKQRKTPQRSGLSIPNLNPSGTNWSCKLSNWSPKNLNGYFDFNLWKLRFNMGLHLQVDTDFNITTTGASRGRESVKIADIDFDVSGVTIGFAYNFQTEFDEHPIQELKGTIQSNMDLNIGTSGIGVQNYRTPVKISSFKLKNVSDANKDVKFYIGSQFDLYGGFISTKVDFGLFSIKIGPLVKLIQRSTGGCYFTARWNKDLYDGDAPDYNSAEIHTCAEEGEQGCITLSSREVYKESITVELDLYFKSWSWDLTGSGEKTVENKQYYNSLTNNSGWKEGVCPHLFYQVPVGVWLDDNKQYPAANMTVTVSDSLNIADSEMQFITTTSDSNGKAYLYLPYKSRYQYTCIANGEFNGKTLTGSKKQTGYMLAGRNNQVDIIMKFDAKVTIKTNFAWDVDADEKDVPNDYGYLNLVIFKRKAGTDDEWQREDVIYTEKSRGWAFEKKEYPKFGFENNQAFLYEYRVRLIEEAEYSSQDYDIISPEERRCYILKGVDAYDNVIGKTEQSHATKYYITYDETRTEDILETDITASAVIDITLNKIWSLNDPQKQADSVYLALLQKPVSGWEDKANERNVPNDWVTVMNPFLGDTTTMKSLSAAGVLSVRDDISNIENRPLAIGEVNASKNWQIKYTVPKYRNGVQMQYQGYELDSSVIDKLLTYEYDVKTQVSVSSFGDYLSVPGLATAHDDYTKSIKVINTDMMDDNTLMGTVRWETLYDWNYIPDYVDIHILKNSEEIPESPIKLYKSDYDGQDTWIWYKDIENYDPNAEYTVSEYIPDGPEGPEWVGVPNGLNVFNYQTFFYNSVQCEVQAVFEDEPDINEFNITIDDKVLGPRTMTLRKSHYWYSRYADVDKSQVKDISEYVFNAPDIPGYTKYYGTPYVYTRPGWGNVQYNFTVYYMRQSDHLKLHVEKEWTNTNSETLYPEELKFTVYRDDEKIAEKTITKKESTQAWDGFVIDKDNNGNNLRRVDDTGHKYVYTIIENNVEGFTSKVIETNDTIDDIYYTVQNQWVGEDYVNVKGKVSWAGDEDKTYLRPEKVKISVVNSKEEFIKSIEIPSNGDGTWEARYLPAKDSSGSKLTYSIVASHVYGYKTTYDTPVYNEESKTWICNSTNTLTGYYPINIKKVVEGTPSDEDETYKFMIEPEYTDDVQERNFPQPVNSTLSIKGSGDLKAEFLFDEDGLYLYSIKEEKGTDENCVYDTKKRLVLISRTYDEEGKTVYKSWIGEEDESNDSSSDGSNPQSLITTDLESDSIVFTNTYPNTTIEKSWDIDLENKDRPDSIEVVVQKKKDNKWETVKLIELNDENNWKTKIFLQKTEEKDGQTKDIEYRVRELKEETALAELTKTIKEQIKSGVLGSYDDVIGYIKNQGGSYYQALPDSIKNAMDSGINKLKEELGTTTQNVYDKLVEQLGLASSEDRIVYDSDDSDKPNSDDSDKNNEANRVSYHVGEYQSVLTAGTEDAHVTRYKVEYEKSGDTYKITNKAILEIDLVKRWIGVGVDDEDMPDSAWVVLLFKPNAEAMNKAGDMASSAGVDISSVLNYEFPVFTPFLLEGGNDPLSIVSELALGVDLNIFSGILPKVSIERVTEDDDWKTHYVVSKYAMGIPMEYKGAELGSEIIRQLIKYFTGFELPLMYNPFDNYFSIPTKAIKTIDGITDPSDFLDFSKLSKSALNKAKSLTMDDIKDFGPGTLLDDWRLMANVINIKIDWDPDDPDDSDKISGKKIWKDDAEDKRPDTLIIHVKDGDQEIDGSPITLKKSDFRGQNEWAWEIKLTDEQKEKIDHDALTVTEEFPDNYQYKDNYTAIEDDLDITNTWHDEVPDKITISGKKIWKDSNDQDRIRPKTITVRLLADGQEKATAETSKNAGWRYFFPDQPKYKTSSDDGGSGEKQEISYTIEEVETEVITGTDGYGTYAFKVDGFNLINTHTPETVEVNGKKTWNDADDQDGKRPDLITIRLKANGEEVQSKSVTEADDWQWSFKNLPKYKDGKEIEYTITEDEVEGYEAEIESYDIANKHTPETVNVAGSKIWNDNNNSDNKRPESITIRLKANGKEVASKNVTEEDDWKWTFNDLPKYENGKEISYIISEDNVKDYTSEVNGYDVINTYTPGKTQINVSKIWDDSDNKDGIRPNSVTIRLFANGKDTVKSVVLSDANKWSGSFKDLDVQSNGDDIEYTVAEDKTNIITGTDGEKTYSVSSEGDSEKGYVFTNTHTPETITIEGSKIWDDNNNEAGKRPDSIIIRLRADGIEKQAVSVSESDDWKWNFEYLPRYKNGKEIKYTISEDSVEYYSSEVSGYNVTNTYSPEEEDKTHADVFKVWYDEDDKDGIRPESVTVKLLADNEATDKVLVLSEENDWHGSFTDLAKYQDDGKTEIVYTIEEATTDIITGIDGDGTYYYYVSGDANKGFTVINKHTPITTSINVKKVWDDGDNRDGIRPDIVMIKLYADDEDTGKTLTLSQDNNWMGSFDQLDATKNGNIILYSVEENTTDVLTGTDGTGTYSQAVTGDADSGFVVTNTHTPETITIEGSKIWDDNNNEAGKRPDSITIRLKADGIDDVIRTVTQEDEWKWSFEGLPKYDNGREIKYSISEDIIPDYTSKVDGYNVINRYTPNKTQVNVIKVWDNEDSQSMTHPDSVLIRLRANGKEVDSVTISESNDWKWSFTDLPVYDNDNEITYTVTEDVVPGYTTEISGDAGEGFTVYNTYTPDKTQITVTKVWDDDNNRDAIRPESISVRLFADGTDTEKTLVLSETNNWSGSFTELYAMNDGKTVLYTVEEVKTDVITGTDGEGTYAVLIEGDPEKGYTITNTHTPVKVTVEGKKTWNDEHNRDRKRPDSITIRLKSNGTEVETKTVTEKDRWKWSFDNLPKYENGNEIVYTITEDVVTEYTSTVDGYDVTNTYTLGKTQINVTKRWEDADDQDGIRPKTVTVKLFADGTDTEKTLVLSETNNWSGSFTELYAMNDGKTVLYTVEEVKTDVITGTDGEGTYAVLIEGDPEKGYTVTNTHTPKRIDTDTDIDTDSDSETDTDTNINTDSDTTTDTDTDVDTDSDTSTDTDTDVNTDSDTSTDTDTDSKRFTITYKLNGGNYNGSSSDIKETYAKGTVIKIHDKPTRNGYKFLYWKGSEYQPGDSYTVIEDHTFVAQWESEKTPSTPSTPTTPVVPGTPVAHNDPNTPITAQTGDTRHVTLWFTLMAMSLIGITAAAFGKRRRTNK